MKTSKQRFNHRTIKLNRPHAAASARNGEGQRKRPPLVRAMKIFAQLKENKYPNCSTLAADFEISAKSALRDIQFLQDGLNLPIEYDQQRFGYHFTGPVGDFPAVPVTEREFFSVCVAQKLTEQYQGTAWQQSVELFLRKCLGRLDDEEQFTMQGLDQVLSFRPFAPDDADLRLTELLVEAIRERHVIEFAYRKPGEKSARSRRLQPYHLFQFNSRWYVLGFDEKSGEIRKFVPGRMRDARVTGESFERPADFDPRKHFNHSLGVMTGAGDFEVVIEMDAWLADVMRGRRWHPSQSWTDLPSGGCQLQMRLDCLEEIEQWVLSWGTRATVLRPQVLANRVASTARELAARYAQSTSADTTDTPASNKQLALIH